MKNDKIEKLHKYQIDMLKEIIRICEDNNIQYFLTWGSALGTVRHSGFIPWDDDIDISMTWNNYKKFEEVCNNQLNEKYFYQSQETDKYCFTTWNKVRINNTTSMEKKFKHIKCHYGICLDIFPIIGVPESKMKKNIQKIEIIIYRFLKYERYLTNKKPKGNYMFNIIYGLIPKKIKIKLSNVLLNDIVKYDCESSQNWVEFLSGRYEKMIFRRDIFGEGIIKKFEDIDVMIPQKYDEYLKQTYGDYMTLPKESERVGHGDAILDFNKSYECYW